MDDSPIEGRWEVFQQTLDRTRREIAANRPPTFRSASASQHLNRTSIPYRPPSLACCSHASPENV